MNDFNIDLTLEQEFNQRQYHTAIDQMSKEELTTMLKDAVNLLHLRENTIRYLIKEIARRGQL